MKKGNLFNRFQSGLKRLFSKKEEENHYSQVESHEEVKERITRFKRNNNRKNTRGRVTQRVPIVDKFGKHSIRAIHHSI